MAWRTFWMQPTGQARLGLRRYRYSRVVGGTLTCADGSHDAITWTDVQTSEVLEDDGSVRPSGPTVADDDPRWPVECGHGCGYRFTDEDEQQEWWAALYRRSDTGALRVLHPNICPPDAPSAEPGAMWDAAWYGQAYRGPDGIHLIVRCPSPGDATLRNDWPVDAPADQSGGRWTRVGDPRAANLTVNPSIMIGEPGKPGSYHGWLHDGVLSDPL